MIPSEGCVTSTGRLPDAQRIMDEEGNAVENQCEWAMGCVITDRVDGGEEPQPIA